MSSNSKRVKTEPDTEYHSAADAEHNSAALDYLDQKYQFIYEMAPSDLHEIFSHIRPFLESLEDVLTDTEVSHPAFPHRLWSEKMIKTRLSRVLRSCSRVLIEADVARHSVKKATAATLAAAAAAVEDDSSSSEN